MQNMQPMTEKQIETIIHYEWSGRPVDYEEFIELLERKLQRPILPQKRGPKFKVKTKND